MGSNKTVRIKWPAGLNPSDDSYYLWVGRRIRCEERAKNNDREGEEKETFGVDIRSLIC